jgi:hypothetical protein
MTFIDKLVYLVHSILELSNNDNFTLVRPENFFVLRKIGQSSYAVMYPFVSSERFGAITDEEQDHEKNRRGRKNCFLRKKSMKHLQFKLSVAFCNSLKAYRSASTAISPFFLIIAAMA